jgi:hypothetical protein
MKVLKVLKVEGYAPCAPQVLARLQQVMNVFHAMYTKQTPVKDVPLVISNSV